MAHEEVYGFCENKCKVRVAPKTDTDAVEARVGTLESEMDDVEERATVLEGRDFPVGAITPYAGSTAPNKYWKICDGSSLSATTHAALYAVIGTKYGGNSTNFKLPDLRGRVPIGVSSSHTLASTGGAETVILTENQIPSHTHKLPTGTSGSSNNPLWFVTTSGYNGASITSDLQTYSAGAGQSHNNMQPYITLNYIIKVK